MKGDSRSSARRRSRERRRRGALTGIAERSTAMAARRHTPGEQRRQAKPSQATTSPQRQHHHGGATALGTPVNGGSSRIHAAEVQHGWGRAGKAAKARSTRTRWCAVERRFDWHPSRRRGWPETAGLIRRRRGDHGVARAREREVGFREEEEKGSVRPTEPKCGSG